MTATGLRVAALVAAAATALALGAATAGAQTLTGRHAAEESAAPRRLGFSVGAGVLTSGDLFTVPGDVIRNWLTPAGTEFAARRFTATLDENFDVTLGASYLLAPAWRLRLDLSFGELDVTVLARSLQDVQLVRYDKLSAFMAGLAIERALTATTSFPYLFAGGAVTSVSGDVSADFDQTAVGLRLGGGFHWAFDPMWAIRLEIRDTIHQLETRDHHPRLLAGGTADVEEVGPQHFFEIGGGLSVTF